MENIYLKLTELFNCGKLRAIISSGQAVVLYKLAVMSKDGDWIVREDEESFQYILSVLESFGANYRFGAPLDVHWLQSGWSSHFEFPYNNLRVRTDFVSRPPRVDYQSFKEVWNQPASEKIACIDLQNLINLKKTQREKDYPVIGELARKLTNTELELLNSRSAQDILRLAALDPSLVARLESQRPLLSNISNVELLEEALDKERRELIRADRVRMQKYAEASSSWLSEWRRIEKEATGLPLRCVHDIIVREAHKFLPSEVV